MYDKPIPVLLMTDFYKVCHRACYAPGTTQLVSYWTPRGSRIEGIRYVVSFGLQAFIKKYLLDYFEESFFARPWEEVREEYVQYVSDTFYPDIAQEEIEAFHKIHMLGHLPIQIRAVPEGLRVPVGCPMIEFRATEEWSFWLAGYLETLASCNLWFPMTAATIADHNRALVDAWYDKTVDDSVSRDFAAGDFSMRGMPGVEAAVMADAGHLLSFRSTATVPTAWWLHNFYNAPFTVCKGTPSMEHSVVESYGKMREQEYYERVATVVRPSGPLSMVSDTWDLWRVITEYLPNLKDKLMRRDGKVVIRPDSGDPVEILCGTLRPGTYMPLDDVVQPDDLKSWIRDYAEQHYDYLSGEDHFHVRIGDILYSITCYHGFSEDEDGNWGYEAAVEEVEIQSEPVTPEMKGVVELLWEIVGGTENSKGFRVLDSHFGVIYGDAITHDRAEAIFSRLAEKGFAANNVILGFGSYTYQYVTRDTFGFALKVTHGIVDGKERAMFKDPVTDKGKHSAHKKSQKGMCVVSLGPDGITYTDGHTMEESDQDGNLLRPVFRDGQLLVDEDFETIRSRLRS